MALSNNCWLAYLFTKVQFRIAFMRPCCSRGDAQHFFTSTMQSPSCWHRRRPIYLLTLKTAFLNTIVTMTIASGVENSRN